MTLFKKMDPQFVGSSHQLFKTQRNKVTRTLQTGKQKFFDDKIGSNPDSSTF